jgi:hypothetical protein
MESERSTSGKIICLVNFNFRVQSVKISVILTLFLFSLLVDDVYGGVGAEYTGMCNLEFSIIALLSM